MKLPKNEKQKTKGPKLGFLLVRESRQENGIFWKKENNKIVVF